MKSVVLSNGRGVASGRKERLNTETRRAQRKIENESREPTRKTGEWGTRYPAEEGGEFGEAEGEALWRGGAHGKAIQDGEVNSPLQLARFRL